MASSAATTSFSSTLATSITLCDRFSSSLSPDASLDIPPATADAPSPLVLLSAAAATLRSQVTKISLLAINVPFTPSAITTCLGPLNESILTSLVTASLLTTPKAFTASFSTECFSLAGAALRDLQALLRLVERRSQAKDIKAAISEKEKREITEATGRVWDDCDKLGELAREGVPGFITRKSKQWLDLMKDAVKELEDWDPEEEIDDNDLFGEDSSDEGPVDSLEDETGNDRAAISVGVKDQALKVLSRIPQSVHVIIKQRLEKRSQTEHLLAEQSANLGTMLTKIRQISELIDESAEGLYLGNLELCLKKAGEARAVTIEVVQSVTASASTSETKEDIYVRRALEWIQKVEPGALPDASFALPSRTKVDT